MASPRYSPTTIVVEGAVEVRPAGLRRVAIGALREVVPVLGGAGDLADAPSRAADMPSGRVRHRVAQRLHRRLVRGRPLTTAVEAESRLAQPVPCSVKVWLVMKTVGWICELKPWTASASGSEYGAGPR